MTQTETKTWQQLVKKNNSYRGAELVALMESELTEAEKKTIQTHPDGRVTLTINGNFVAKHGIGYFQEQREYEASYDWHLPDIHKAYWSSNLAGQLGVRKSWREQAEARQKRLARLAEQRRKYGYPVAPPIEVTNIYGTTVDEWYGIHIEFEWKQPFTDHELFEYLTCGENVATLTESIASQAKLTKSYRDYYSRSHRVLVDEDGAGGYQEQRERFIPEFYPGDFNDWEVNEKGGYISASSRD